MKHLQQKKTPHSFVLAPHGRHLTCSKIQAIPVDHTKLKVPVKQMDIVQTLFWKCVQSGGWSLEFHGTQVCKTVIINGNWILYIIFAMKIEYYNFSISQSMIKSLSIETPWDNCSVYAHQHLESIYVSQTGIINGTDIKSIRSLL